MAVAYPSPPPPVIRKKASRKRLVAVAAIVILLLLVISVAGFLALRPAPALSLSPTTVAAGDPVVVIASHLPPNQRGEIRLHSPLQTFTFRADSNGNVSQSVTVPQDEGIGDHTIQLCWNSSCRITAILHVFAPVALVTPSPESSPPATPGATPTPASTPSPAPTSNPTPTPLPSVTVDRISQANGFSFVLHYTGGGTWSIYVYDVTLGRNNFAGTATVPSGNTYYPQKFSTTPTGVMATHKAYVSACHTISGRCYSSSTVTVTLT